MARLSLLINLKGTILIYDVYFIFFDQWKDYEDNINEIVVLLTWSYNRIVGEAVRENEIRTCLVYGIV